MTYEPIFVSAPKPRRTGRTVAIALAVVLAVCCLGGAVTAFWLKNSYDEAAGPARDAASAYTDDVLVGDYPSAYERLCAKARKTTSLEEFIRVQSAQLKFTRYEISGVTVTSTNGHTRATVMAQLTQETGAVFTQVFPMVKEDGAWRVCE